MRKLVVLFICLGTGVSCSQSVEPDCLEKPYEQGRVCTQIYQPVCGCNGKTYGNACEAIGYGITTFNVGECKNGN